MQHFQWRWNFNLTCQAGKERYQNLNFNQCPEINDQTQRSSNSTSHDFSQNWGWLKDQRRPYLCNWCQLVDERVKNSTGQEHHEVSFGNVDSFRSAFNHNFQY